MRWTTISLAALSISGAACYSNNDGILNAGSAMLSKLMMPQRRVVPVNSHQSAREVHPRQFFDSPGSLFRRQDPGRCGAAGNNRRCSDNLCCSEYGWCGDGFDYCAELVGCQPQFGRCGDAPLEPTTTPTPTPTPTPSSSSSSSSSSISSSRTSSSSTSSAPQPTPTGPLIISTNGQCGNVTTCAGSGFGGCCSEWYFCGSSNAYCGTGCRSLFGNCGSPGGPGSSSSSSPAPPSSSPPSSTPTPTPTSTRTPTPSSSSSTRTPTPTPTQPISTDGRCGSGTGCQGSTYGDCCSEYGWCGSGPDYCRRLLGCQPQWGACDAT